nr:nascent polypeptide-associated complex subunit alpha, muscle-specific form-like [Aegilops tauschii subsp. strangulata]
MPRATPRAAPYPSHSPVPIPLLSIALSRDARAPLSPLHAVAAPTAAASPLRQVQQFRAVVLVLSVNPPVAGCPVEPSPPSFSSSAAGDRHRSRRLQAVPKRAEITDGLAVSSSTEHLFSPSFLRAPAPFPRHGRSSLPPIMAPRWPEPEPAAPARVTVLLVTPGGRRGPPQPCRAPQRCARTPPNPGRRPELRSGEVRPPPQPPACSK